MPDRLRAHGLRRGGFSRGRPTPQGRDVLVVELDATLVPTRIVGSVTGAGMQDIDTLVAIVPDALALSGTTDGALTFGSTTFDTGNVTRRYVGVLGL